MIKTIKLRLQYITAILGAALLALTLGMGMTALADDYPNKPVQLKVAEHRAVGVGERE